MTDQVKMNVNDVDDSKIQKSSLLKIFTSNDSQMLDSVIGELDQETLLLAKKLIIILIGKKKGVLKDKALKIVTDPDFLESIFNGNVDIDRLKTILKFEMDDRVDNSLDARFKSRYVKIEELMGDLQGKLEETYDKMSNDIYKLEKDNDKLNKELSHYKDKLVISERFYGLKYGAGLFLDLMGIINKMGEEIQENMKNNELYKIFDLIFDFLYILHIIEFSPNDHDDKLKFLNYFEKTFMVFEIPGMERLFKIFYLENEDCDPFILKSLDRIKIVRDKINEIRNQNK